MLKMQGSRTALAPEHTHLYQYYIDFEKGKGAFQVFRSNEFARDYTLFETSPTVVK